MAATRASWLTFVALSTALGGINKRCRDPRPLLSAADSGSVVVARPLAATLSRS